MNATFFTEVDDCHYSHFQDIPESAIIGKGPFTKDNISELLGCFQSGSSAQTDNLWLLSINFSEALSMLTDENLEEIAENWAAESSWENSDVNIMDLSANLLALKYGYSNSCDRIWVLFE